MTYTCEIRSITADLRGLESAAMKICISCGRKYHARRAKCFTKPFLSES